MKTRLLLLLMISFPFILSAQRNHEAQKPFIGTWKFSHKSKTSEFNKVFNSDEIRYEYFTFESNGKFIHHLQNKDGQTVKVLCGKWKSLNDKISISYTDIDYKLQVDYFFIDKDLVLGQHFNHVVFTKGDLEYNVAMK